MDFVWPYFRDSAHGPELELSMRSVEANFKGNARLVVIGDLPSEINIDFVYIHCPRITAKHHHAFYDTFNKIKEAIHSTQVAEKFVWIHDDVFFINDITSEDLKSGMFAEYKTLPELLNYTPSNNWLLLKKKTMLNLFDSGHRYVMDFDTHAPMFVDSQHLLQVFDEFDIENNALLWQSVYGNTYEGKEWKPVNTSTAGFVRITRPLSHFQIAQRCQNRSILNFTNSAWSEDAEAAVRQLINEPVSSGSIPDNESDRFPCMGNYRQSTNEVRKHGTCGSRGLIEEVYHCTKFDTKVTINQYNSYQPEKVCKKCELLNWQPNPIKELVMEFPLKKFAAVIPYCDRGGRRRGFEYVRKWAKEKFEIVLTPEQPADEVFNKSRLINQAVFPLPDDTTVVLLDADSLVSDESLAKAVEAFNKAPNSIIKPFTDAIYLSRNNTEIVHENGHDQEFDQERRAHRSDGGITILSKIQYDAIGGHDERYTEWGWEDTQFIAQARNIGIDIIYIDGVMLHLWHPRNPNRNMGNKRLFRNWNLPEGEKKHIPPSDTDQTLATYNFKNVKAAHGFFRKFAETSQLKITELRSVAQLKRGMQGLITTTPVTAAERAFFKRATALRIPLYIIDNDVFGSKTSFLFSDATEAMSDLFYHGITCSVQSENFEEKLQSVARDIVGEGCLATEYAKQGSVIAVCDLDDISKLKMNVNQYANLVEAMFANDVCEFYFPDESKSKTLSGKTICKVSEFFDACKSAKYVVAGSSDYLYKAELAGANAFPLALHPFLNRSKTEKRKILFQLISQTIDGSLPFEVVAKTLAEKSKLKDFWTVSVDSAV